MLLEEADEADEEFLGSETIKPALHSKHTSTHLKATHEHMMRTVEARTKASSRIRYDILQRNLHQFIEQNYSSLVADTELTEWDDVQVLDDNLELVRVAECCEQRCILPIHQLKLML